METNTKGLPARLAGDIRQFIHMLFRLDQLGKNILRDFFGLVGAVETEVEVPAGDAQRIDRWHHGRSSSLGMPEPSLPTVSAILLEHGSTDLRRRDASGILPPHPP